MVAAPWGLLARCLVGLTVVGGLFLACSDSPPPTEEPAPVVAICGNGKVEAGEACDDDDTVGDLACDDKCQLACGNGVVDAGEQCDAGLPQSCPEATSVCDDGDPCTVDSLDDRGCQASCQHYAVVSPECCGPQTPGCASDKLAYRFTSFKLRDPHVFVELGSCLDMTDAAALSVNAQYAWALTHDDARDGLLDYSPVLLFDALEPGMSLQAQWDFANCKAPVVDPAKPNDPPSPVVCWPGAPKFDAGAIVKTSGTCLDIPADTLGEYYPPVVQPSVPCFVSTPITVSMQLGGIPLKLLHTQVSARLVGEPASGMVDGVVRGFLPEPYANVTIIPSSIPLVGGQAISMLLPGGDPPGEGASCAPGDDRDIVDGQKGWWVTINFSAERTLWSDTPLPLPG